VGAAFSRDLPGQSRFPRLKSSGMQAKPLPQLKSFVLQLVNFFRFQRSFVFDQTGRFFGPAAGLNLETQYLFQEGKIIFDVTLFGNHHDSQLVNRQTGLAAQPQPMQTLQFKPSAVKSEPT